MTRNAVWTILALSAAFSAALPTEAARPVPAAIFGQNLEHTRAALEGGLSAQLVKNRKFAGKPSRQGVAAGWGGYGKRPVFDLLRHGFTHHAAKSRMFRQNEISSQFVESLDAQAEAGIRQGGIALRGGIGHEFRAALRALEGASAIFVVRLRQGGKALVEKRFPVTASKDFDWKRVSFRFTPEATGMAELSIGVEGRACGVIGVVSILPDDNFRGMRPDVIEHLRKIGTSIVRWPGGNFAGEYRWRDGYIADRDERAPLQSYTEIETQTYSYGYDQNDIAADDVIALCEKIGAVPFFTINAVWDAPEDSAEWVRRCKGKVKLWSLGNEMGYAHMEGPQGPEAYAKMVRPHAEAMLKADPTIKLTASGNYPAGGQFWIDGAAIPLADIAPRLSYHNYPQVGYFDFSTPERTVALYRRFEDSVERFWDGLRRFRKIVPRTVSFSIDEWNVWYPWYRDDGIAEGLFAAKMLHNFLREWETLGIEYVCYFQAVNELAISVGPFDSRLTSTGEAMRLTKGHVGGTPVGTGLPDELFVTETADGSRYATFYNFDIRQSRDLAIPAGACTRIAGGEILVPNGFETGCRWSRNALSASLKDGFFHVKVPPASVGSLMMTD